MANFWAFESSDKSGNKPLTLEIMDEAMKFALASSLEIPTHIIFDAKTYHYNQARLIPLYVNYGIMPGGIASCAKAVHHLKEYRRLGGDSL